jgi:hypothetical protein
VSKRKSQPRWAVLVLAEIRRLVALGRVRFTLKATQELAALELGLDEQDALQILSEMRVADLRGRVESECTPEWLYVCKPEVGRINLYVKLIVRSECVVISFHEDEGDADEEA